MAFQAALRAAGEALIDRGCSDFQLTIGVAEIADAEGALERLEAEADEIQRRIGAAEQRGREYESSLRFAIGELRFECQQTAARGEPVAGEITDQLAKLEHRLAEVMREASAEIERLTDRAIGLAAEKDEREQVLARLYRRLDRLVADLVPRFAQHGNIKQLADQLQRLRYRRELLG
jgi:seryl-tRNA synthetase